MLFKKHANGFSSLIVWLSVSSGFAAQSPEIRFSDITRNAGLIEPLAGIMGHGGAWGDFDADGKIDLFVGGFCDRPDSDYLPAPGPVRNRLFRNIGNGRFETASQSAVETYARTSGAVFADLDNNGTLELYVANNAQSQARRTNKPQRSSQLQLSRLFQNDGGRFVDISGISGACPEGLFTARNVGVFDYNGDGLLDLFVVEDRFTRAPDRARSVLLRNLGGLKFAVANHDAGLPDDIFGLGLAAADLNDDRRPDFFVGHSNRLFLSRPDNTFREATELRDVFHDEPLDAEDWPCGVAFGDLNRDGLLDLVVSAHFRIARNRVFLNDGVKDGIPRFHEVTKECGLGDPVPEKCPHVEIQDFDNDGWPDIYLSAAWLDSDVITPLIYRNTGLSKGVPQFVPPRPIRGPMVYFPAGPSGDFDGDGRLDLFLINWFSGNHCRLLRNESHSGHWLQVRVMGETSNSMGIGAKIRVFNSDREGRASQLLGFQEIGIGFGYASGQPAVCHFGLGDRERVDVEVRFPKGGIIRRADVSANRLLTIREASDK